MARRNFKSFEELGRQEQAKRLRAAIGQAPGSPAGTGDARLRVRAELAGNAGPSELHECRAIVLEWLQETLRKRLPRKAWRQRPFSHSGDNAACRAVGLRDEHRDFWAVQVERTPGQGQETVTEIVVARPQESVPSVGVAVRDRSVVPVEAVSDYPADMLATMAERLALFQGTGTGRRRLTHRPIVVESAATMNTFISMLVDPGRDTPFAVASVPPDEDRGAFDEQVDSLARSLTGLAVTWVLPGAMTYDLSDTVSKPLSVFLGAWRFYRPGFHPRANRSDHPLVLRKRMADERAVRDVVRQFLRMAAEERMRADPGADEQPDYAAVAREAASVTRGPGRLVSFLRNSIRGGAPRAQRRGYTALSGDADPVDGAAEAAEAETPAPVLVSEPQPAGTSGSARHPPAAAPRETPMLRRKLTAARETARERGRRYEQARQRAEKAERERDEAVRRATQLAGLVRSMGGDPDAAIPFPATWNEFAAWCDENLAGRLALTASAQREVGDAEFRDVGLAARCLGWLASKYRDGRLKGGNPRLHGRIDDIADSVFNVPCGGDSFECSWDGRTHTVDWHIKGGANTRDPRRCMRIYYFWDERTRQVVVASMPAHRRTAYS